MRDPAVILARLAIGAIFGVVAAQSTIPSAWAVTHGSTDLSAEITDELGFAPAMRPNPRTDVEFTDIDGRLVTLGDRRGKVVLLNLWATWCPPCVREMPALDRLQAKLGGPDFEVVVLSEDRAGAPLVIAFYDRLGLTFLGKYLDPNSRAMRALKVLGLPTTILIDRDGNEVGRVIGPAEWDSDAAVALIRHYVGVPSSATAAAD